MRTALAALLLAFLTAVLTTPLVRRVALRLKVVDDPRDGRRVHRVPIPRLGGIALGVAVTAPIAGLALWENQISDLMFDDARAMFGLFVGAAAALAVGLADDLFRPRATLRIGALCLIAAFSWLCGYRIELLDVPMAGTLDLGLLGMPVTVLWIVGVVVALNFIDGLDGLAAGLALIATLTMSYFAWDERNLLWLTWTAAMAGSLLGFLVFNFNPASIFMGDSGSNLLGFLMALVALETSRKGTTAVALAVPLLILGLPLLDAALTMLRRALLREGMFMSERGHLHHRLLDLGLSHRRAVLVLWGVSVVLCLAVVTAVTEVTWSFLAAPAAVSIAVFGLMFVTGYVRPEDLRQMWQRGLQNRDRDRVLTALSADIARELPEEGARTARVLVALERLTSDGGISGAEYQRSGGAPLVVGDFDGAAKGVRASFSVGDSKDARITLLWRDRTSGPTRREVEVLGRLVDAIAPSTEGGPPEPSGGRS
jgi:UDP-GlcNAc:undecaprenyl-phosphate GlcNAc-1-phosphate transferase